MSEPKERLQGSLSCAQARGGSNRHESRAIGGKVLNSLVGIFFSSLNSGIFHSFKSPVAANPLEPIEFGTNSVQNLIGLSSLKLPGRKAQHRISPFPARFCVFSTRFPLNTKCTPDCRPDCAFGLVRAAGGV